MKEIKIYNYKEHKDESVKKWVYNSIINEKEILEENKKLILIYTRELDANGLKRAWKD